MSGRGGGGGEEFSYRVSLTPLIAAAQKNIEASLEASEEERSGLAARFGIVALERFKIHARLSAGPQRDWFRLVGEIEATPVQNCVVTLEPVTGEIRTGFDLVLVPEDQNEDISPEGPDFEYYRDQEVDIGEVATVELALALDPYPRKPDAELDDAGSAGKGVAVLSETEYQSAQRNDRRAPFAALAELRKKE